MDTKDKKTKIFERLMADISIDAIQEKDFGVKSKGYNMGYLIERMNKVLIENGWSWTTDLLPITTPEGQTGTYVIHTGKTGDKQKTTVTVRLKVYVFDENIEVIWAKESFGGCQMINNSLGDTLKGAQTDGLKKAFSYLGVGNSAFKDCITDQLREFHYKRREIFDAIKTYLSVKYKMELEEITQEIVIRFITSVTKKEYTNRDEVLYKDWLFVLEKIESEDAKSENTAGKKKQDTKKKQDDKKKVVKNESENGSGEDKVLPLKEKVDNSD